MFTNFYKFLKTLALVASMTRHGIKAPILVSKDGVVLDGNTRLRIAKSLGIKEIPAVIVDSVIVQVDPNDYTESY